MSEYSPPEENWVLERSVCMFFIHKTPSWEETTDFLPSVSRLGE